uniref:Uncharacterized protein n=1 Tax=Parascaris equorum TaxID=6256 RepID=A0A914RLN0_PAREQ
MLLFSDGENKGVASAHVEKADSSTEPLDVADSEKEGMLTEKPPPDKYHLVYLIMLLHGVGTLMPWNMFITIAPAVS